METLAMVIFAIGYLMIALEHPIKINKSATAILTGVLCWTLFAVGDPNLNVLGGEEYHTFMETSGSAADFHGYVGWILSHKLAEISSILFFLMGAMTIVELVDAHDGFQVITNRITTRDTRLLLWIVCWVSFFLSAILDNLTTSIVMVSLVRKLVPYRDIRMVFAGMIIIAANAGGAWSPIGDVTTTMLWIGGQISSLAIISSVLLPGIVSLLVPLIFLSFTMKGKLEGFEQVHQPEPGVAKGGKLMLVSGIGVLVLVPLFKTVTHLPPYMGMLLGLGAIWVVSEFINPELDDFSKRKYSAAGALSRIDVSSVLFFFGILLAVGALESMQILRQLADGLNSAIGDNRIIITLIGMVSAIVDNVPLVAACMGMYPQEVYPMDHELWSYLAYCAGTGGSLLIIGSAAGVAVMGMEQIDFVWYLKKISFLALLGYAGGAITFVLMQAF